jgi:hypothetical protein
MKGLAVAAVVATGLTAAVVVVLGVLAARTPSASSVRAAWGSLSLPNVNVALDRLEDLCSTSFPLSLSVTGQPGGRDGDGVVLKDLRVVVGESSTLVLQVCAPRPRSEYMCGCTCGE